MVKLGKITFRELLDSDLNKLQIFCDECKSLGYNNNASFDSIKLAKMKMPYGKYFIGIDDSKDKIFNLAGVHHLPEVSNNAWRCLFRGAQLPGYNLSKGLTKNIFLTGYQLSYILPLQINFIRKQYPDSVFYMSSNTPKDTKDASGKSMRMDKLMHNTLFKEGVLSLWKENFELFYTSQTIWQINESKYWQYRKRFLPSDIV